ncbi:DUF6349 family protein [Corynebacterium variabile]|uniref:DUF6349 family protein n=1 Tax=Corynebacterium variabile TaxID=1727 RepID=UPI003BAFA94D
MMEQFDLLEMMRQDREAVEGVASLYGLECTTTSDYRAAFDHWQAEHGHFGSIPLSHAWHQMSGRNGDCDLATGDGCEVTILCADTRCNDPEHDYARRCQCVGDLTYRAVCDTCHWSSTPDREHEATLAALDHCFENWRDSPVVSPAPSNMDDRAMRRWSAEVVAAYGARPLGWPVITARTGPGTRAVAGRSPWRGYDVAVGTL